MTIPTIPGFAEDAGAALGSLADSIATLINPNAKFNQAMKIAFLQNPELMQKFVDVEKANPGTLKAFGFNDKASDLLSGMQESIPALKARVLAPEIAGILQKPGIARTTAATEAATGRTPGELEADDFSAWFTKEGRKLLAEDPVLFVRAARAKFGVGTNLEQTQEEAALDAYKKGAPLRELPPMAIVHGVLAGKFSGSEVSGVLVGPERAGVEMAMKLYQLQREEILRRLSFGISDELTRMKLSQAIDSWQGTGRGSVSAWYKRMFNETPPIPGGVLSNDLNEVDSALRDQSTSAAVRRRADLTKALEPILTDIKKGGKTEEQKLRVDRINQILREVHSPWTAYWQERTFFSDRIMFRNNEGQVTEDASALTSDIAPANTEPEINTLTDEQKNLVARLRAAPIELRVKMVEQIRARKDPNAETIIRLGGGE